MGFLIGVKVYLLASVAFFLYYPKGCYCQNYWEAYNGYRLVSVTASTQQQLDVLNGIEKAFQQDHTTLSKFYDGPQQRLHLPSSLLLAPNVFNAYMKQLVDAGMKPHVVDEDMSRAMKAERKAPTFQTVLKKDDEGNATQVIEEAFQVDNYNRYTKIYNYLHSLAEKQPKMFSVIEIGRTVENRSISLIKIVGKADSAGKTKPAIFIEAGIHAREWISPSTALYLIKMIDNDYDGNPNMTSLVDQIDWYILPVTNPDGYEYTFTKDRMWRKNRRLFPAQQSNRACEGVDLNRNFDWYFGTGREKGMDPCDGLYPGAAPFTEPESIALRDFIINNKDTLLVLPYSHKYNQEASDKNIRLVAEEAAAAIATVKGTKYIVDTAAKILYTASGLSMDWAYGKQKIPYSYTLELPPSVNDYRGFNLPSNYIVPVGNEIWEAMQVFAKYVIRDFGNKS